MLPTDLGNRLTAGQRTLTPSIKVRILVPQPNTKTARLARAFFVFCSVTRFEPRVRQIRGGEFERTRPELVKRAQEELNKAEAILQ
jgi:hypothetical protein